MILGFTGKAGSGKSTACAHLLFKSDRPRVKVNFKDALVAEIKKNFAPLLDTIAGMEGMFRLMNNGEYKVDQLFVDKPPLMRKLLQCYGTEVRRGDDPDYWIKKWKSKVAYTKEDVLVDDVRFLNEAEAVRDMGGVIIRIIRKDITDTGSHQSEQEMDQIQPDYTIVAEKDGQAEVYRQVDEIIREIEKNNK
jgi:uridine kinase